MSQPLARDVMTKDVTTVPLDCTAEQLIQLFRESHFTAVPVVDAQGCAVGLVSETDVLRALAYTIQPPGSGEFRIKFQGEGKRQQAAARLLEPAVAGHQVQIAVILGQLLKRTVQELMSPVVHSCRPDEPLALVCETMVWKEIHRVIVTDEANKVVGLITSSDTVRSFGEHLRKQEKEG